MAGLKPGAPSLEGRCSCKLTWCAESTVQHRTGEVVGARGGRTSSSPAETLRQLLPKKIEELRAIRASGSAARSRVVSVALQHDGHHDSVTVTSESAADGVVQQSESGDEQPNDREEYSEPWFRSRCTLS